MTLSELGQVRLKAMDLLARREHSQMELKRKLHARTFAPELIEQAVAQLAEEGLQSDARFADAYATMRANRGYGNQRIEQELQQRGVSAELIGYALEGIDDWRARAMAVRDKKFGAQMPGSASERAKQMRFLQYRGFDGETIRAVFQSINEYE